MKYWNSIFAAAIALVISGCVSAERQAEYAAWQASEDGIPSATLAVFESQYQQGWRERAEQKKKERLAREEAERVLARRRAEYSRWLASDDKEEGVTLEVFEQKYKEGWEARAAQKKQVRLAREERERQEARRKAELAELQSKRDGMRDAIVATELEAIRKAYAKGVPYRNVYQRKATDWLKEWSEPRLGLSETDKLAGEAILSAFGTKYLPNAYANYEKKREALAELQQVFNEEFAQPWAIKSTNPKWNSFNKVLEKFAKARTEFFMCHDELCHYWLLSRFGALGDKDFQEIDAQSLAVRLLPENVERAGYTLLGLKPMEEKIADFAVKYAPESHVIYQKMNREFKELEALLSEVFKQHIQMDDVRFSRVLAAAVAKRNVLTREMNTLSLQLQTWYTDHRTTEKSSEDVAKCDADMVKQLKPFIVSLPGYIKEHALGPVIAKSELVAIPGRCYRMQRTEVTKLQWMVVMGDHWVYDKRPDLPVECVSWDDCQKFIRRVSKMDGVAYRLPTAEEWKHACRAGSTSDWGKRMNGEEGPLEMMGWCDCFGSKPVALKEPNAWGLFDMHGNLEEWCAGHLLLGGSFRKGASDCAASHQIREDSPSWRYDTYGFRLVAIPEEVRIQEERIQEEARKFELRERARAYLERKRGKQTK